jgi:hypothetical protein
MGMPTCSSTPVKAKVAGWWNGMATGPRQLPEWMLMVSSLEQECYEDHLIGQVYDPQTNPDPTVTVPQRVDLEGTGWIFEWQMKDFKSSSYCVHALVISKEGKEIYVLNTDQYSGCGEITVEFFALGDNAESDLLDFVNDLIPHRSMDVETDTTVHQWM